mmetsp:Transcript_2006/g.4355  ORF Transcript_2006/g.4355 Transcript_2006/m.4355 type:complete len:201 (+) Transcript_2006:68-670(+)
MDHVAAFIDTTTASSVPTQISYPSRSINNAHRRSSLPIYFPRKSVSSNSGTQITALPPGTLFFDVAYDVADVEPSARLVDPAVQLFAETTTSNVAYATDFSASTDLNSSSVVLFVMLAFGVSKIRTNSISSAAKNRKEAAKKLNVARVRRIAGEDGIGADGRTYAKSELAYRDALDKENQLPTILPTIEMISPIDPVEDI